jgi:uncharacterized protein
MRGAEMEQFQKRIVAALAAVGVVLATSSYAEYADATKAYNRGDFVTAYREYLALAEAGDVRAQGTVACMLQAGEGVSRDPAQALPWYQKAAEKGLEPAQYSLAHAYENGVGTERDLVKALTWYGKAAQQGDTKAQEGYQRLKTLPGDPAKAPTAATTAAPFATTGAPFASASSTLSGVAVTGKTRTLTTAGHAVKPPSPAVKEAPRPTAPPAATSVQPEVDQQMPELIFGNQAFARKLKAAGEGDTEAQVYVGWCYSSGKEVELDKAEALKWYRKAAQSGSVSAQTALGWMYFSGESGKRDLAEAAKWYKKAAAQGYLKAKQMLKRIERQVAQRAH